MTQTLTNKILFSVFLTGEHVSQYVTRQKSKIDWSSWLNASYFWNELQKYDFDFNAAEKKKNERCCSAIYKVSTQHHSSKHVACLQNNKFVCYRFIQLLSSQEKIWKHGHEAEWLYFQKLICSKRKFEVVRFSERILPRLAKSTHQKQQIHIGTAKVTLNAEVKTNSLMQHFMIGCHHEMLVMIIFKLYIAKSNFKKNLHFCWLLSIFKKLCCVSLDATKSFTLISNIIYCDFSCVTFRLKWKKFTGENIIFTGQNN